MHITRPLEQYRLEFKDKFREVAGQTFDELANDSHVDVEANSALCTEIDNLQNDAGDVKRRLSGYRCGCVLLWIVVIGAVGYIILGNPDATVIIA